MCVLHAARFARITEATKPNGVSTRCFRLMSFESNKDAAGKNPMERRLIRVDNLPDQAGIAAALRRAFAGAPAPVCFDNGDPFAELLKRIH